MKDAIERLDDSRKQWALRLHNQAAQQLTALQMNLALIDLAAVSSRAAKAVQDASDLAQACAREIRSISNQLHPALLDEVGLAAAVRALAADVGARIAEHFEDVGQLPSGVAIGAYRIVEEILMASKEPERVVISLSRDPSHLKLVMDGVADRGDFLPRLERLRAQHLWSATDGSWSGRFKFPLTTEES